MDAPANGSPRELGPSVVGGAGASSRFERQDATHAEAGSVIVEHQITRVITVMVITGNYW